MKKAMNKATACVLTSALIFSGVMTTESSSQAAEKATLVTKSMSLTVGKSATIKLKKVSGATYTYKSANTKIATVTKKGKVTAKKAGSTKVTVKQTKSGKTVKVGDVKVNVTAASSTKITSKNYQVYGVDSSITVPLYYVNGCDIPYITIEKAYEFYTDIEKTASPTCDFGFSKNGSKLTITRKDKNATATIDFDKNTVTFPNFNLFFMHGDSSLPSAEALQPRLFPLYQKNENSYDIPGKTIKIDLNKYGIDLIHNKDLYLLPLQTANDIFGSNHVTSILFNGVKLYISNYITSLPGASDDYYNCDDMSFSDEFAQYNYYELCLALDLYYGLKKQHDIDSFDQFFTQVGLKSSLMSKDTTEYEKALYTALMLYIDDIHTVFGNPSHSAHWSSVPAGWKELHTGFSRASLLAYKAELDAERNKIEAAKKPYYEQGDTAYITFNGYDNNPLSADILTTLPKEEEVQILDDENGNPVVDAIRLMQYAGSQILRKNSPIKKVVLDMTTNRGGSNYVGVYVLAAILGNGPWIVKDNLTGAKTYTTYRVDNNLDGKFDKNDSFAENGLKLYCLTSSFSFSNGNLVPSVLKNSGKVTIIGKESGGGSCAVKNLTSARGTMFNISSPSQFSYLKNGTFYDIDRGVTPDISIPDVTKLFDRQYTNSLLK